MNYITGSSSKCGAVREITYGTAPSGAVTPLRMTAESLRATYNRLDEGVLLASKTAPQKEVGSVTVDGTINTVLNPSFVDWLFDVSLGEKSTSEPQTFDCARAGKEVVMTENVYTLRNVNQSYLPSSTVRMNRGSQGFIYTGMTVSTLTLNATAQDFVKADISFTGREEQHNPSSFENDPGLGSYKCTKAKLWPSTAGSDDITEFSHSGNWDSCPTETAYNVESTTLTIDNGIQTVPATYCSGLYANQPSFGQRSVTIACNIPYSSEFEVFRRTYYSNENPDMLALMLMFGSKENISYYKVEGDTDETTEPSHQIYVILPNVSITDSTANANGDSLIEASFTGEASSANGKEPLKIIVRTFTEQDSQE